MGETTSDDDRFNEWWATYRDMASSSDMLNMRVAWMAAADAERERCASVAEVTFVFVPYTGDHGRTAFGADCCRRMAEAVAARIREGV